MSMALAIRVWRLRLDKTEKFILMALCDIADDDGTHCFPSPGYVAWKTDCSLPTIYRTIAKFETRGILAKVGMYGDTTEYEVHLEVVPAKAEWKRPQAGRPRKNPDQGDKPLSSRQTFVAVQKDSHHEKSRVTVIKPLSPRQKSFHGDKGKQCLPAPPERDAPGENDSKHCADPSYISLPTTHPNEPSSRASEARTMPPPRSPALVALARKWANGRAGVRFREGMAHPFDWQRTDQLVQAFQDWLEWSGNAVQEVAGELVIA